MFINHYLQFNLDYFSTIKLYTNDIKNKHFHIAVINSTVSISRSYMDNYTMAVMISMSTMAYAAILFTMYFIRKERSLILFTLAFVFATISGLSLSLQNLQNEFFGIIIFNVSFYLFFIYITSGYTQFFKNRNLPQRIWMFFLIASFSMLVFTYVFPIYWIREVITFALFIIVLIDFYRHNLNQLKTLSRYAKYGLSVITIANILAYTLMGVIALFTRNASSSLLFERDLTLGFVLIQINFACWVATIFVIGNERLIRELNEKNERLFELSKYDYLTGLYARRFIEEETHRLMARANRYHHALSVFVFDIDYFKTINNQHGHTIGDQVLREVSKLIKKHIRNADLLSRWGGDEFLVVLPHTNEDQALQLAQKLSDVIGTLQLEHIQQLTISGGVAEYHHQESFDDWFNRADQALYQAKNRGRNLIYCLSSPQDLNDHHSTQINH